MLGDNINEVSDASSVKHVKWQLSIERQRKSSANILVRQNPKPPQILLTESPVVLLSAQLKHCCSPQMFFFPPCSYKKTGQAEHTWWNFLSFKV